MNKSLNKIPYIKRDTIWSYTDIAINTWYWNTVLSFTGNFHKTRHGSESDKLFLNNWWLNYMITSWRIHLYIESLNLIILMQQALLKIEILTLLAAISF